MGVGQFRKLIAAAPSLFAAVLFCSALAAAEAEQAPLSDSPARSAQKRALDESITKRMNDAGIVGAAAAVIVDRKVVWLEGWGYANQSSRTPFTPETVINVGSISKTVTGAALMRAVQDGKLSLDTNVNAYLPFPVVNPFFPDAAITLRQLGTAEGWILRSVRSGP